MQHDITTLSVSSTLRSPGARAPRAALLLAAALLFGAACVRQPLSSQGGGGEQRFRSPEAAADALVEAASAGDREALFDIFGDRGAELLSSGDEVADAAALDRFRTIAAERSRVVVDEDGATASVQLGFEGWPFPVPLVRGRGGWFFDTVAGEQEVLNRRIGRNELSTIRVAYAYVDAQRDYARRTAKRGKPPEYAQKLRSTPGKRDGLYWDVEEGEAESPMGPLLAHAEEEGYAGRSAPAEPQPYHGYYFRILTAEGAPAPRYLRSYVKDGRMTGGFALVAWPAEYGTSGVMTFVVNQLGIVFEKDLGPSTGETGRGMVKYAPDESWLPVERPAPLD